MAIPDPDDITRSETVRLDPEGAEQWLRRVGHVAHGIDRQLKKLSEEAPTMCGNDARLWKAVGLRRKHQDALDEAHLAVGKIASTILTLRDKGKKAIRDTADADADGADRVHDSADRD